jgi:signal transduction histidine kinase
MLRVADTKHAQDVREERARLAIDLHDEVLPALFKVHLMGQVLKLDLDSGRLLDVDQDLLQLLDATDRAAEEMRAVISSLRRTSLDRGGVTPTLELLAKDLSRDSKISIELDTSEIGCAPLTQLLIYQVAREALRNAMKHSEADRIVLRLHREGRGARLTVSDDGRGFSLDTPAADGHFGLQMMRERVRMAGGEITIQSQPGEGTEIIARFPQDVPTE